MTVSGDRCAAPSGVPDGAALAQMAAEVMAAEVRGIAGLAPLFAGDAFRETVRLLAGCRGRILILGIGKSGIAGQRIAASLRSTGSPSLFVHPVEALHGDLGVVDPEDVVLLISKSGENPEVSALIPTFRRLGVKTIGMTAAASSELSRAVDVLLCLGPVTEIAPLTEVPTVSTTLFQVIGDALTVILCRIKGFSSEDFAFLHPGGILGHRVNQRIADVMHTAQCLPRVAVETPLAEVLAEIIDKRLGMTTVVGADGRLAGIVVDGDLKRILQRTGGSIADLVAGDVMNPEPCTISRDAMLVTALQTMENHRPGAITSLVIVDETGRPEGVVHLHDCLRLPTQRA